MNYPAITQAVDFLKSRGHKIPTDLLSILSPSHLTTDDKKRFAEAMKTKAVHSRALKQTEDYQTTRDDLWQAVYQDVTDFLYSNARASTYANQMATSVSKAYIEAADIAYQDGGGSLPMDDDSLAYAKAELSAQLGYVDSLFETLKTLRKEGDYEAIDIAFEKARSWTSALDGFYNSIKLLGAGNKMLTWVLGGTEKHCKDCLKLDGGRHRASWYSSYGYTPRRPGSATECGGYNCDCSLIDDDGEEFTI